MLVSFRPVHRNPPSKFVAKSVGHFTEWALDKVFVSSAVVAPVAAIAAVVLAVSGFGLMALAAAIVAGLAGIGIYARYYVPWQLRVKHLPNEAMGRFAHVRSASAKPIKIVFFSDLHLGLYKRREWAQKVVDLVNAQLPDVVLIGGDLVGQTKCCDIAEMLAPLAQLRAPLGVFAVLGNHDHGLPGVDHGQDLAEILPSLNVRLMCNECVRLSEDLRLVGVEELWTDRDDLPRAIHTCDSGHGRLLVLGHNPDLMARIEHDYPPIDTRDAFFLFGHTHQGQIHLPFAPGLAIPITSHYYRGTYHTEFGSLYVSSGLGESGTPTRFNTWPEIVVLEV